MHFDPRAAGAIASALASSRVALIFGGVLLLTESVVLASSLFAVAGVSFVASVVLAAKIYGVRAPRPPDAEHPIAPGDAARA